MRRLKTFLLVGGLALLAGCAGSSVRPQQSRASTTAEAIPLALGDKIRVANADVNDSSGGFDTVLDSEGYAHFLLGTKVHVAGLTPSQAALAIEQAYQPKLGRVWSCTVVRVQPSASPNSGPTTSVGDSGASEGRHR